MRSKNIMFPRIKRFQVEAYAHILYSDSLIFCYIYTYITLHSTPLHSSTLHITLHYTTLHYITLHYITLQYITLHYIPLHYITLQSSARWMAFEVLRLARNLPPGSLLIDAGVFDGTDWSLMGILAGATVIGFEPLLENRKLIDDRLPVRLSEYGQTSAHTFLHIEPGEAVPFAQNDGHFQISCCFWVKSSPVYSCFP